MDQKEYVMDIQRRADHLLNETGITEHDAYAHAITAFMREQRTKMPSDNADHLHAFLLHNFGIK
ncbi:hypothetical protein HUG20_16960 [Salicibibacter cibi]|uniref:Uncharacterized protein n=1 Tax=Salicibibacter cibi TaxID=2743001 RepID=A0A7T6ZDT8_9BACI|nr:hypothetical protein [Salicibibacter cibi]QQK81432.1 hypothetical protein HUG20_16960 [Salicibibacter cibi]